MVHGLERAHDGQESIKCNSNETEYGADHKSNKEASLGLAENLANNSMTLYCPSHAIFQVIPSSKSAQNSCKHVRNRHVDNEVVDRSVHMLIDFNNVDNKNIGSKGRNRSSHPNANNNVVVERELGNFNFFYNQKKLKNQTRIRCLILISAAV